MKIINFIKKHPAWTIWIITLTAYFVCGMTMENTHPVGFVFLGLSLTALFAPAIRRAREEKREKKNMDYLAKKIAEEQKQ